MVLDKWPEDAGTAALELRAGEAAAELKDYRTALAHYGNAARGGRDSVAAQAMWQRVAVTDAWYESTRGATAAGVTSLGRDSLAHAVVATAEELLKQYPEHPHAADLMRPQGDLEKAQGWFDPRGRIGRMATRAERRPRAPRRGAARGRRLPPARFGDAGAAYEVALTAARHAGGIRSHAAPSRRSRSATTATPKPLSPPTPRPTRGMRSC